MWEYDDSAWRAVLGVFPDGDKSEEAAAFAAAASALRNDFEFGLITDASLLAEAKECVPILSRPHGSPIIVKSSQLYIWLFCTPAPRILVTVPVPTILRMSHIQSHVCATAKPLCHLRYKNIPLHCPEATFRQATFG